MKVRHLTILALVACSAIFGVQVVLAAKPHRHSNKHQHKYGFAVLKRAPAKISDARQQFLGIPPGAVLATTVGQNKVYVFQRVNNLKAQTCVANEEGTDMAGATVCGSAETAEREGLSLINPMPNSTQTLILLVPNGVKTVSATTRDNGNVAVAVTNNVVVISGHLVAYHFVSPSGAGVSIPLEGS